MRHHLWGHETFTDFAQPIQQEHATCDCLEPPFRQGSVEPPEKVWVHPAREQAGNVTSVGLIPEEVDQRAHVLELGGPIRSAFGKAAHQVAQHVVPTRNPQSVLEQTIVLVDQSFHRWEFRPLEPSKECLQHVRHLDERYLHAMVRGERTDLMTEPTDVVDAWNVQRPNHPNKRNGL